MEGTRMISVGRRHVASGRQSKRPVTGRRCSGSWGRIWSANPDRNREVNARQDDRTEKAPGIDQRTIPALRGERTRNAAGKGPVAGLESAPPQQAEARGPPCRAPSFPQRPAAPLAREEASLARYEHAPCHVTEARYLGDYKVYLEFNDGRRGVVDLADELYGEALEPLRDREHFAQFYLDHGLATIAWHGGQDFTPEFLYERLKPMH